MASPSKIGGAAFCGNSLPTSERPVYNMDEAFLAQTFEFA